MIKAIFYAILGGLMLVLFIYKLFFEFAINNPYANTENKITTQTINKIVIPEEVVTEKEEINYEKIIHQYYQYIFGGKLQEAYNLKVDSYAGKGEKSISFKDFQSQYTFENKHEYIIENIIKKDNIYEVELLTINTGNDFIIKYVVGFEFQGKLLFTKYVNTINREVLDTFNIPGGLVTIEWESGIKKLYIDTNGNKKFILSKKLLFDTYNDRYDYISYRYTYNNFELKDSNRVLKFDAHEWEQPIYYEYNLLNNTLSDQLSYFDIN